MSKGVHVKPSRQIGEKAATNEVITKLVNALGDQEGMGQKEGTFSSRTRSVRKQRQMK